VTASTLQEEGLSVEIRLPLQPVPAGEVRSEQASTAASRD